MKKILLFLVIFMTTLMFFPAATIQADTGPKPSLIIDFKGFENENYYATVLSEDQASGVQTTFEMRPNQYYTEHYDFWDKFVTFEDPDGYYFLQILHDGSISSRFAWTYFPPPKFKILLYFPDQDQFVVSSEIYETYSFDSYYTVYFSDETLQVERNYRLEEQIISFAARVFITIAIEILIALLFKFREKRQILIILFANIGTQIILNILLNATGFQYGFVVFAFIYISLEVVVYIIEALLFYHLLNRPANNGKGKSKIAILYALVANIASFISGLFLSILLPVLF